MACRQVMAIVVALTSCRDTPPVPASTGPLATGSEGSSVAQAGSSASQSGSPNDVAPYAAALARDCNLLTVQVAAEILGVKPSTLKPHVEPQGDHMIMCGFEGLKSHKSAVGYQMVHFINVQAARDRYNEFVADAQKLDSYVPVEGVGDGAAWAKLEDTPALATYKGNLLMFVMLPRDQAKATVVAKKIWSGL